MGNQSSSTQNTSAKTDFDQNYDINYQKFGCGLDFGQSTNTAAPHKIFVIDLDKLNEIAFYFKDGDTFSNLKKYYLENKKLNADQSNQICFRKGKSSHQISFNHQISCYINQNRSYPIVNVGKISESTEDCYQLEYARVAESECLPLPKIEKKIRIKVSKKEQIEISYIKYFSSKVKRIIKQKVKDARETYCLTFGNQVLLPNDYLCKIERFQQFKNSSDKIRLFLNKSYDKIMFSQIIKNEAIDFNIQDYFPKQKIENLRNSFEQKAKIVKNFRRRRNVCQFSKIIDSIQVYTSNSVYKQFNKVLRQWRIFDGENLQAKNINLLSSLSHSLQQFPNFYGTVFRGTNDFLVSEYYKVGECFCWKSFTSTSKDEKIGKRFIKAKGTFFHITSVTGKDISQFSAIPAEKEVLFSPFCYFVITRINKISQSYEQAWIVQLPSPERFQKNIILWVDDKPKDNIGIILKFEKDIQFMQLLSTKMAEYWFNQFGWILDWKNLQIKVISDMVRKQQDVYNYYAGIDLLQSFFNKYRFETQILIYCKDVNKANQNINKRQIAQDRIYKVTNQIVQVQKFINFPDMNQTIG